MSSNIENNIEQMGDFFDLRADGYDNHMEETINSFEEYYKNISEPINETNDEISILDLGCGTGIELEYIFEKAPNAIVTGIDMSENMLDILINKYKAFSKQINLIKGSYLDVPFDENKYDYVISSMTMHHFVPSVKGKLYEKIKNSIKAGGKYIEGDYVVSIEKDKQLLDEYHSLLNSLKEGEEELYHIDIPFSFETQKELFIKAGFDNITTIWEENEAMIIEAVAKVKK